MIWQNGELSNPQTGKLLERDSLHSFSDGTRRFPVIDEIPFLRAGREKLIDKVLQALDSGDKKAALILLFCDQDDWAKTPPPTAEDLKLLVENPELSLRGAMQCLKYGAVADYFAYRWSDPTFLSGLALLEHHLPPQAKQVFELCCGIGHYLREFEMRGILATGADVVFSKLWLARKYVSPAARLVCTDANFALPFADNVFEAALCHDAIYFLPKKQFVANELQRVTDGAIMIGHAHNLAADNFSSGAAVTIDEYKRLFENPILYDDAELTRSVVENRRPQMESLKDLTTSAAIALIEEKSVLTSERQRPSFVLPISNRRLQLNPLLENDDSQILATPRYPSKRYENEYSKLSNYLNLENEQITFSKQTKAFEGDWFDDRRLTDLVRRRIFLDLPENW